MSDARAAERLRAAEAASNGAMASAAEKQRKLLYGAKRVDDIIPVIARASNAILEAGSALQSIAGSLEHIGADTARALSDTAELKRYLKMITEREASLRAEFNVLKRSFIDRDEALKSQLSKVKVLQGKLKKVDARTRKKRKR